VESIELAPARAEPGEAISNQADILTTAAALRLEPASSSSATTFATISSTPDSALVSTAQAPPAIAEADISQPPSEEGSPPALSINVDQLPGDPELGVIRVRNPLEDPELGILRIRQQPDIFDLPAQAPPKIAFLTARVTAANSDNILLVVNDVGGLTGGTFFRPAATLGIYPSLGPQTVLIGTVDIGLQRYNNQPTINYDDWRFRLGIRQGLSPRAYGQLSLTYQELFRPGATRTRFFENKAVGLTLGRRDPLTSRLVLDSYYQIQFNDARSTSSTSSGSMVTDFSRLSQLAGFYLGYTISPQFETGVGYQLNLIDYTTQARYDTVQQLFGQIVYNLTPRLQFSLYGGWSFGRSSNPRVRFDDTIFGFTIEATAPLF
jgi:hypothetical protein